MEKLIDDSNIRRLGELLGRVSRVVLTCHVRPDGDAVGSTLGLAHVLQQIGKQTTVIAPDMPPRNLSFLPGFKDIAIYTCHEAYCRRMAEEAELIICCDFNKPDRQDKLADVIQGAECPKVMIDHHQFPDPFAFITFSYPDMSSTCELAFRIIAALGLYTEVTTEAATCLLTGMITDTRNFTVNTRHPDIYEILIKLIECGADKTRIVRLALETRSYWSMKLESYALDKKLEIYPEHCAAIITLCRDELKEYHYQRGDTEGLVNRPLEIPGVIYSIFLREDNDCIKVSGRSLGDFPVSEICEQLYGGGGHRQAAGAEYHGTLQDCRQKLLEALPDYDHYISAHSRRRLREELEGV